MAQRLPSAHRRSAKAGAGLPADRPPKDSSTGLAETAGSVSARDFQKIFSCPSFIAVYPCFIASRRSYRRGSSPAVRLATPDVVVAAVAELAPCSCGSSCRSCQAHLVGLCRCRPCTVACPSRTTDLRQSSSKLHVDVRMKPSVSTHALSLEAGLDRGFGTYAGPVRLTCRSARPDR